MVDLDNTTTLENADTLTLADGAVLYDQDQ